MAAHTARWLGPLATLALAACGALGTRAPRDAVLDAPGTAVDRSVNPSAVTQHLEAIQRLLGALPEQQAEMLVSAQRDAEASRLASARLRHALLLATPGHAGFDAAAATVILRDVLAVPLTLPPPERALALVELQRIDGLAVLAAENRRLKDQAGRNEREQILALRRALQNEQEESARLRKALEDARAKLEAIGKIETGDRRP